MISSASYMPVPGAALCHVTSGLAAQCHRYVKPEYDIIAHMRCRSNNSATVRNEAPPNITPIASLNAYQARWTIRARVTSKSEMRRFSNARGEGVQTRSPVLHPFSGSDYPSVV